MEGEAGQRATLNWQPVKTLTFITSPENNYFVLKFNASSLKFLDYLKFRIYFLNLIFKLVHWQPVKTQHIYNFPGEQLFLYLKSNSTSLKFCIPLIP